MNSEHFEIILYSITVLTVMVQAYVFYLIQYESPKSMQEYRFFLNLLTFYDVMFTVALGAGLQPDAVAGKFASWCRGFAKYFGPWAELYMLGITIFFGSNMIIAQDYCLMYRFSVIQPNKDYHRIFMSIKFKIGFFIFAQSVSIPLGIYMYKMCYTPEEFPTFISMNAPEIFQMIGEGGFIMWINLERSAIYVYMTIMLILFLISETICITLIKLIMSSLKKNSHVFSNNTYRLHAQLTILLGLQLMTPFILVLVPMSAAMLSAFLGVFSSQLTGQIGYIVIETYGIINAILTIAFVSPYRKFTYTIFIHSWLQHLVKVKPVLALNSAQIVVLSSMAGPSVARVNNFMPAPNRTHQQYIRQSGDATR